ncbi:hypothetical protein KIPB_004723 [Kipferlia bialata]|uniref:Transmembrane protein n=1 Tax=Kipferlia bialata TaxID=797122 RepID=A0A9K3CVV1_9EUKA|nr:hypothetical protein KIPB_004723 [Kipferlia bialata]|eukprot:g4723.t1
MYASTSIVSPITLCLFVLATLVSLCLPYRHVSILCAGCLYLDSTFCLLSLSVIVGEILVKAEPSSTREDQWRVDMGADREKAGEGKGAEEGEGEAESGCCQDSDAACVSESSGSVDEGTADACPPPAPPERVPHTDITTPLRQVRFVLIGSILNALGAILYVLAPSIPALSLPTPPPPLSPMLWTDGCVPEAYQWVPRMVRGVYRSLLTLGTLLIGAGGVLTHARLSRADYEQVQLTKCAMQARGLDYLMCSRVTSRPCAHAHSFISVMGSVASGYILSLSLSPSGLGVLPDPDPYPHVTDSAEVLPMLPLSYVAVLAPLWVCVSLVCVGIPSATDPVPAGFFGLVLGLVDYQRQVESTRELGEEEREEARRKGERTKGGDGDTSTNAAPTRPTPIPTVQQEKETEEQEAERLQERHDVEQLAHWLLSPRPISNRRFTPLRAEGPAADTSTPSVTGQFPLARPRVMSMLCAYSSNRPLADRMRDSLTAASLGSPTSTHLRVALVSLALWVYPYLPAVLQRRVAERVVGEGAMQKVRLWMRDKSALPQVMRTGVTAPILAVPITGQFCIHNGVGPLMLCLREILEIDCLKAHHDAARLAMFHLVSGQILANKRQTSFPVYPRDIGDSQWIPLSVTAKSGEQYTPSKQLIEDWSHRVPPPPRVFPVWPPLGTPPCSVLARAFQTIFVQILPDGDGPSYEYTTAQWFRLRGQEVDPEGGWDKWVGTLLPDSRHHLFVTSLALMRQDPRLVKGVVSESAVLEMSHSGGHVIPVGYTWWVEQRYPSGRAKIVRGCETFYKTQKLARLMRRERRVQRKGREAKQVATDSSDVRDAHGRKGVLESLTDGSDGSSLSLGHSSFDHSLSFSFDSLIQKPGLQGVSLREIVRAQGKDKEKGRKGTPARERQGKKAEDEGEEEGERERSRLEGDEDSSLADDILLRTERERERGGMSADRDGTGVTPEPGFSRGRERERERERTGVPGSSGRSRGRSVRRSRDSQGDAYTSGRKARRDSQTGSFSSGSTRRSTKDESVDPFFSLGYLQSICASLPECLRPSLANRPRQISLPHQLFRPCIQRVGSGRLKESIFRYQEALACPVKKEAIHRASRLLDYNCQELNRVTDHCGLEILSAYLFNSTGIDSTGVSLASFLSFVLTISERYRHDVPYAGSLNALDTLQVTHLLSHSIRSSPMGTTYFPADCLLFAFMGAVSYTIEAGVACHTAADGRVHAAGSLHKQQSRSAHSAALCLMVAKQTNILRELPVGSCDVIRSLICATSPDDVGKLILELEAYAVWLEQMTQEERESLFSMSRPKVEEDLPALISVPTTPLATLQSLILRAVLVVASLSFCGRKSVYQDRSERWKAAQTLEMKVDKATFGFSRNWEGTEDAMVCALRETCFYPLVCRVHSISVLMGIPFFTAMLEQLRDNAASIK